MGIRPGEVGKAGQCRNFRFETQKTGRERKRKPCGVSMTATIFAVRVQSNRRPESCDRGAGNAWKEHARPVKKAWYSRPACGTLYASGWTPSYLASPARNRHVPI